MLQPSSRILSIVTFLGFAAAAPPTAHAGPCHPEELAARLASIVHEGALPPPTPTLKDLKDELAKDTPYRDRWIRAENRRLKATLAQSPNFPAISQGFRPIYEQGVTLTSQEITGVGTLRLIYHGATERSSRNTGDPRPTTKSMDLVLETASGTVRLYSNQDIGAPNRTNFASFRLSPDSRRVALVFAAKGSTDRFEVVVYDLQNRRVLRRGLVSDTGLVAWLAFDTLAIERNIDGKSQLWTGKASDAASDKLRGEGSIIASRDGSALIRQGEKYFLYDYIGGKHEVAIDARARLLGATATHVYYAPYGGQHTGISRVQLGSPAPPESFIPPSKLGWLEDAVLTPRGFLVHARRGAVHHLEAHDLNGTFTHLIPLPDCCSFRSARWLDGQRLEIRLSSAVVAEATFVLDVPTLRWEKRSPEEVMLTSEGVDYRTSVVQVAGSDGMPIPMRLTHRADLELNGNNPTLIEVYGGFNLPGHLAPLYRQTYRDFLRQGGILAGPAVRGGNEFGPEWHQAGQNANKLNTIQDVIASARWLTANRYTQPAKTVLTGGSNGGFVTSTAALTAPDAFGLAIPINGLSDMERAKVLDARFDGWSSEYSFGENAATLDPLRLAQTVPTLPSFLIIGGRQDSRVNPAHSYQLTQALRDRGAEVSLVAIRNAGHHQRANTRQDQDNIAWRTDSIIWTAIYDQVGLTYPKPATARRPKLFDSGFFLYLRSFFDHFSGAVRSP